MRIQQYPFGFLSLLNAKSSGETPMETEPRVGPSLELGDYYLASIALTTKTGTNAAQTVVGSVATVDVPAGEAWQVVAAMASLGNGTAATDLLIGLRIQPPDFTFSSVVVARTRETLIAAGSVTASWTAPRQLIVGPGTQFQAQLLGTAAFAVDVTCRVLYRPLPV